MHFMMNFMVFFFLDCGENCLQICALNISMNASFSNNSNNTRSSTFQTLANAAGVGKEVKNKEISEKGLNDIMRALKSKHPEIVNDILLGSWALRIMKKDCTLNDPMPVDLNHLLPKTGSSRKAREERMDKMMDCMITVAMSSMVGGMNEPAKKKRKTVEFTDDEYQKYLRFLKFEEIQ